MAWSLSIPGPRSAWHGYCSALERRPVATKSLTSLVGFMLGDALAQFGSRPSRQERQNMLWRYGRLEQRHPFGMSQKSREYWRQARQCRHREAVQ